MPAEPRPVTLGEANDARGQLCPQCQKSPTSVVRHQDRGVVTLNLLCPAGHIWQTKWSLVA